MFNFGRSLLLLALSSANPGLEVFRKVYLGVCDGSMYFAFFDIA